MPIQFFGKPFSIKSTETRHCLHGPTKVITSKKVGEVGEVGEVFVGYKI